MVIFSRSSRSKTRRLPLILLSIFLLNLSLSSASFALSAKERQFYGENKILFFNPDVEENPFATSSSDSCVVDLGDSAATILNFLINKSYSKNAAAGIVGNLMAESGLKPNVLEGGKTVGSDYVLYNLSSDSSNYPNKGFGLGQWTTASRQKSLQLFANENGLAVTSLEAQLGYLIKELSARGFSASSMSSDSVEESTFKIFDKFEVPGSSFWTTQGGKYYNDYDPKSLSELSPEKTPAAYKAFNKRLGYANSALAKISNSNLTGDFSASSCENSSIAQSQNPTPEPSAGSSDSETEASSDSQTIDSETQYLNTSSSKANAIAELAVKMAWPYSSGANAGYCRSTSGALVKWNTKSKPKECSNSLKEENAAILKSLHGSATTSRAMDCSWFVGDVMKYLNFDPKFPSGGSSEIYNYSLKTSAWVEVKNLGNTSNLKPGDIFVVPRGSGYGHVMIYVGSYGGSYGNAVGASKNSWVARIHNIYFNHYTTGAPFRIMRLKE